MNKLTHTERRYYDAWSRWRTFKKTLPPWEFFGTKEIMRDHILLIEQFEAMFNERMRKKEEKERLKSEKNNFERQQFQQPARNTRVKSVL